MEHNTNQVLLIGCLASAPVFSHDNHGKRFFSFYLEVSRLSGTTDQLQILAPEGLLQTNPITDGNCVRITGQIRSFNNRSGNGRRLVISVLADSIEICNGPHDNQVCLSGVICKTPVYRKTPLGREICDIMLAVNRLYHRSDYLPCILWGKAAQETAQLPVGTALYITGRLQSRNYIKLLDGAPQQRTAYEISVITVEIQTP